MKLAAWTSMALALPALADITTAVLDDLTLFSQYSAAAYCSTNLNSTGVAVTCSVGNCPLVEAADTQILYDFDEYYLPITPPYLYKATTH
jgi:triacylglycerol lipase